MDINSYLNNEHNQYLGHGIGANNPEVVSSIIKNGLRCSHGALFYTSIPLGIGSQITDLERELLQKWPHKDSEIIIIISIPIEYKIIDSPSLGTFNMADAAFYYIPDPKARVEYDLTNSNYVMPEFIWGYYDRNNNTFTKNNNYYENLPIDKQKQLFEQIKQNYFNVIQDGCGIDTYHEIMIELGRSFPLSDEEIDIFKSKKR